MRLVINETLYHALQGSPQAESKAARASGRGLGGVFNQVKLTLSALGAALPKGSGRTLH